MNRWRRLTGSDRLECPRGSSLPRVPAEIRWLGRQVRPLFPLHLGSFACISVGSLCALAGPLVVRWLIDVVLPGREVARLLWAAGLIFLSYIARVALTTLGGYLTLQATQKMALDLRTRVLRQLDSLSANYHESTPVGASIYPLKEPIDEIAAFGADLVPSLLRTLVAVLFTLGVMWTLNARTTLAVLPLIPVFLLARGRFRGRILSAADAVQQDRLAWSSFIQEHMAAIIPIQLLRRELRRERKAFLSLARVARSQQTLYRMGVMFTMSTSLTVALAMAIVVGYGGWCVHAGMLTIGGLTAFFSYLAQLFDPLSGAVEMYSRVQKTFGSIRQVQSVLNLRPAVLDSPGALAFPEDSRWELEATAVQFCYGRGATLSVPALRICPGESLAISGANGTGKSTLAKLLVRLYDVESGLISIGGVDIRRIRLQDLRRNVCYVPEHPAVFDGTLAENLRMAKPSASIAELRRVMEHAALEDWLHGLSRGFEHWVGPGGSHLSGGQRQRLAIARALLMGPRILILDESTSCIDASAEQLILNNLRDRLPQSTLIVVSHRVSTLSRFKRVLIMAGGRIVRDGTFDTASIAAGIVSSPGHESLPYQETGLPPRTN